MTHIIGVVLWALALLWAIGHGLLLRQKATSGPVVEHTYETHALLLAVTVVLVPTIPLSPLHILWMVPASFVLGMASVIFPLNLLWFPASLYGHLWYLGLRRASARPHPGGTEGREPSEQLQSLCLEVNEFLSDLGHEFEARGIEGAERRAAERVAMNQFASEHLVNCAFCRGEIDTASYMTQAGMVYREGERVRLKTAAGKFTTDQTGVSVDLKAERGRTGTVVRSNRASTDRDEPTELVSVQWDDQVWNAADSPEQIAAPTFVTAIHLWYLERTE